MNKTIQFTLVGLAAMIAATSMVGCDSEPEPVEIFMPILDRAATVCGDYNKDTEVSKYEMHGFYKEFGDVYGFSLVLETTSSGVEEVFYSDPAGNPVDFTELGVLVEEYVGTGCGNIVEDITNNEDFQRLYVVCGDSDNSLDVSEQERADMLLEFQTKMGIISMEGSYFDEEGYRLTHEKLSVLAKEYLEICKREEPPG